MKKPLLAIFALTVAVCLISCDALKKQEKSSKSTSVIAPNAVGQTQPEASAAKPMAGGGNLGAINILSNMILVYSGCKSYRDTGTATTKFQGDHPFQTTTQFKTAFRRPDDFRFEYTNAGPGQGLFGMLGPQNRMIIHRDKSGTRSWWSVGNRKEETSFGLAIAGATGVSDGTAYTVPNLLLPFEVGGHGFLEDSGWATLSDTEEAGHTCYRVTRKDKDNSETLWIDKTSSLLIRMDEVRTSNGKDGSITTEQTTTYKPEIDVNISEKDLAFDSPAGK